MFKPQNSFNVLYTTSVDKTASFYTKIGIEPTKLESDKVVVSFGSFELHYILNNTEPFEDYQYITHPDKYGQGVLFYIEVENITEAQTLIEEAGGTIKSPIFDNLWGCQELLFEDPSGYKFALYQ